MDKKRDMLESTEKRTIDSVVISLALISVVALAFLVITSQTPNVEKTFSNESFYSGQVGEIKDGKTIYELNKDTIMLTDSYCNTSMWFVDKPQSVLDSGCYWISANKEIDAKYIRGLTTQGDVTGIYTSEDQFIVAPCDLYYTNTNVTVGANDTCYIQAIAHASNGHYRLTWNNIYCWWCHIGKDTVNRHDKVYGAGQTQWSTAAKGFIIGQAQPGSTTVRVEYRKDTSSTVWEPSSLAEFYGAIERSKDAEKS